MTNENKKAKVNLTMENVTEAVEQWRAKGFNVIPFDSHNKIVKIPAWKNFQPPNYIPDEQYGEWYRNGTFNNGLAIMLGKVYNNSHAAGNQDIPLYGIGIDCDNQAGIDLVLEALGFKTIAEASKKVIVNQHRDQNYKAHFILYCHKEIPQKKVYIPATEGDDIDMNEIPRVKIKVKGQVLIVNPSIHKNGYPYEIPRGGTMDPVTMDDLQQRFEQAFKKREMSYANNGVTAYNNGVEIGLNAEGKIPIEVLFNPDYKVYEGNRNNELNRVACFLLFKNQTILEDYRIKELVDEWNKNHCVMPLEKKEVDSIWKSAKNFVDQINTQRAYERYLYQERLRREQEQDEFFASEQRKKEQSKPLTIAELARLNEEDKLHYAAGQLTSIGQLYKRVRTATTKCIKCGKTKVETYPYPVTGSTFNEHRHVGPCYFVFDESTCNGITKKIPEWISSINIEVSDNNTLQDTDKLRYILFGDDTKDVGIGENATLLGMLHMEIPSKNSPFSFPVDYALSIKYESREQEELSHLDVQAIKRFRKKFNDDELMQKFIGMTACHII